MVAEYDAVMLCIDNCRTRLLLVSHWSKARRLKTPRVTSCVDCVSLTFKLLLLLAIVTKS